MLTSILTSSYRAYKEDTDTVATWLASTAKQCGIHFDSGESRTDPTKPSSRLKGKARKLAKESAASGASDKTPAGPKYVLRVKDFTRLAEAIANSVKPLVNVPNTIAKALNRAIKLRQNHRATLEAGNKGLGSAESQADDGHSHFLDVLWRTRELLAPRTSVEPSNNDTGKPSDENKKPATEKRSGTETGTETLQDDDVPANETEDPNIEQTLKNLAAEMANSQRTATQDVDSCPRYITEPIVDLAEQGIAVQALITDVVRLRRMIRYLWRMYQRNIGIVPVGISVNMAIELVRDLEHDFQEQFPGKQDYGAILDLVPEIECFTPKPDWKKRSFVDAPYGSTVVGSKEAMDDLMTHTYQVCCAVSKRITSKGFTALTPGTYKPRDRTTKWFEKPIKDQMADDNIVLHELIPDVSILSSIGGIAEDELIRGWRDFRRDKPIALWFVFAMQCILDAQHFLEGKIADPFFELQKFATATKDTIVETLKMHKAMGSKFLKQGQMTDRTLREFLQVIQEGLLTDFLRPHLLRLKISGDPSLQPEPFRLFKSHPVLCGTNLFAIKNWTQGISLYYANTRSAVLPAVHLYNALKQEGLLSATWYDLEVIIDRQGARRIFVGDPPKEADHYDKRYYLANGVSATKMAKNSRNNPAPQCSKGRRSLEKNCPMSKASIERYCRNGHSIQWNLEHLPKILAPKIIESEKPKSTEQGEASTINEGTNFIVDMIHAANRKQGDFDVLQLGREKRSLPISDFFTYLVNVLKDENLDLTLDYLAIHRSCWTLLKKVEEVCSVELHNIYYSSYTGAEESSIAGVVAYLLSAAAGRFGGKQGPSDHLLGVEGLLVARGKVLQKAATVFREMIESDSLSALSESLAAAGILRIPRNLFYRGPGQTKEEGMQNMHEAFRRLTVQHDLLLGVREKRNDGGKHVEESIAPK